MKMEVHLDSPKTNVMNWSEPSNILIPMSYFNEDGSPYLGDSRNVLVDMCKNIRLRNSLPYSG